MKHTSEALGWVVVEHHPGGPRFVYGSDDELKDALMDEGTAQALATSLRLENEPASGFTYTVEPVGSDPSAAEAMQDDIAELLRALGLGDHARPISPHRVMQDEVIPAVRKLRTDPSAVRELVEAARKTLRWLPSGDTARHDQIAIRDTLRSALEKFDAS